jgi:WD40 repeat protein
LPGYYFALSPDGTTLEVSVSDTSAALMLYGIPEGRAIYPAIPGNIPSEGINLRTAPSSDAPRIDVISGEILVAARSDDGSHVYVANHNGWVRYGPSYIQLALDLPLDWLPILNSPPHWTVAFDPPPPTILPSVATPTATIFSTRTPLPTLAATLPPATSPPPTEIAAAQPEPNGDLRVINTTNIDDVRLVGVIGGDKFAFTPDGSMMVVNKGVQLELWDTATLTRITATGAGDAMQMMPDGRGVLTWDNVRSGRNRRLWYWDIRNPESPQLTMLTEQNRAFAISPDSTTLTFDIFNDNSQTVLWDVQTNTERFSITDPYRLLKYSPDGTRLFLGWAFQRNNADPLLNIEAIHLIDVEAGRQLAVYHRDDVISTDIYFSPDNSLFATGGVNVLISDMATGESHMTIPTRAQIIAFTPDNQVALTFSPSTGLLHTWDISGTAAVEIGDLRDTVSAFHLSDDGTVLVTVHSGELGTQFWDVPSGTRLASFGYFGMDQIAISPDNRFAVFTSGAYVALADILNETWLATPSGLPSNITNLNFSPDSLYLELTLADNSRRLLDIRTSDQFSPISQDFSGRSIFATTSTLGFWLAYNRPDGRYIELTPRYPNADLHFDSRLSEIAFSSDGSTLAVTSADNNARPSLIMIFGVPTPNRPQWQAVEGTIYPEGIDVHTEPRRYSRSIRVLLQGETVQIGGQFENYYYLPDLGGWIRAESFYVTLDDEQRSLIPPLIQVRR